MAHSTADDRRPARTFLGLFRSENLGKLIVWLGDNLARIED
jgi:hypothetical protein